MKKVNTTALIAAMGAIGLFSVPGLAQAQSNAELLKELQSLRDKVSQLETQINGQQNNGVGADDFNRIQTKVEAMEDGAEMMGFKGLKVSGMIDPTYVYTNRANRSGFQFLSNFDAAGRSGTGDGFGFDNSYFGQAMLDLQKETESGSKWRLTLAPHKSASSGYNAGSIVHEASVSIPVAGPAVRVIAGQVPDWSGYEYIWSNMQPLITHNMLFDFTIPSYYSGAGMEITSGKWIAKFMLANINKTFVNAGDKTPGLTYRADYAKGEFSGFGLAGTHTFKKDSKVNLFEVDGYFTRGDLTLQGQIGAGMAEGIAYSGGKASWFGLSSLAGYKVTPRMQLIARADYIFNKKNGGGVYGATLGTCQLLERDSNGMLTGQLDTSGNPVRVGTSCPDSRNGFGPAMAKSSDSNEWEPINTDKGVNRYALSMGMNYLLFPGSQPNTGTWFKTELRLDGANGAVFLDAKTSEYKKNNLMFASSLVVAF